MCAAAAAASRGREYKDDGFRVYSSSKLMLLMATAELHRRLEPSGVECFAAHPGEHPGIDGSQHAEAPRHCWKLACRG